MGAQVKALDVIEGEITARVDITELASRGEDCDKLRSALRRAHAREEAMRTVLAEERKVVMQLRATVASKDRQIDQYEAMLTDLMAQLGGGR